MTEISPNLETIPKDFYQAKRLISKIGLNEVKIDCCLNGCMLYYKDDTTLTHCKFCKEPSLSRRDEEM